MCFYSPSWTNSTLQHAVKLTPDNQPLMRVSEFGLSYPDSDIPKVEYQKIFYKNWQWMAVEIFDEREVMHTSMETDIWAFGMVAAVSVSKYPTHLLRLPHNRSY